MTTLKIGRVSLRSPLSVAKARRGRVDQAMTAAGIPYANKVGYEERVFVCRIRETGASAQTTMDSLDTEAQRFGAVYVTDDSSVPPLPAGYYCIEDVNEESPSGAPNRRPGTVALCKSVRPIVCRQAENDNVTGTDTADATADEGYNVTYTPTTSEVLVLDPRNVAGAEALNLPAGSYRVIARVWQTTNTSAKWRLKTTQLNGTVITTGSQVAIGAAGAWTDIDLGTFTIAAGDGGANWYEIHIQGVASELGDTKTDRLYFLPA